MRIWKQLTSALLACCVTAAMLPAQALALEESDAEDTLSISETEPAFEEESDAEDTLSSSETEPALEEESDAEDTLSSSETEPTLEEESDAEDTLSSSETESALEEESDAEDTLSSSENEPALEEESDAEDTLSSSETESALEEESDSAIATFDGRTYAEGTVIASGKCGTNLTWTLTDEDNDGTGDTLTISGTGAMADYEDGSEPWYEQRSSITSVIIEDGVTSIGNYAFWHETSLNRIAIPTSVITIGDYALLSATKCIICYGGSETDKDGITFGDNYGLDNLVWIYNATGLQFDPLSGECGATANADGTTNLQWTLTDDGTLTISGEGAMADYEIQETPWYDYDRLIQSGVVESGVTTIGNAAFDSCHRLTSITISNSVTSIGETAFGFCIALPSIQIPNSVTSIGAYAFDYCDSLTSIEIPDSVTSISDGAFMHCDALPSITLPSTLTSIGEYAFFDCISLPSIELPDSLISIGECAFYGCRLPTINIPDSVTNIEGGFADSSLSEITVEEGNQYFQSVDNILFSKDGTSLICYPAAKAGTKYNIPDTVTSIAPYAFYSCRNLIDIDIPNSVNSIGNGAFKSCASLVSIEIPNGVSSLGEEMISGCESLTSIYIPLSVTSIEDSAFSSCAKLATVYYGGNETDREQMSIGDGSSYYLLNAEWVYNYSTESEVVASGECGATVNADGSTNLQWTLTDEDNDGEGDTLTISGAGAMADFGSGSSTPWNEYIYIRSIIIEDGVTSIGDYAFQLTAYLNRIAIPKSVTTIGDYALFTLKHIIYYGGSETDKTQITFGTNFGLDNLVWIYNANGLQFDPISGECGATANADGTTNLQWTLTDDGTLTISGEGAMADYVLFDGEYYTTVDRPWCDYQRLIQSSVIEDGVTYIGGGAFEDCSYLTNIAIPKSVTGIGYDAFSFCLSLPSIELPSGVTSISEGMFAYCRSLTNITIPEGVTSIGEGAFWNCSSLPSIKLPSTLTSIGEDAFSGCSSLPSIELPDNLINIGKEAFKSSGLTSITIPENVTSIGGGAFLYTSIPSITIPSSVTSIEGGFASSNLSEIIVEEGNQYFQAVDNILFSKDGTSLICYPAAKAGTKYNIPDTVTSIAPYAFCECSNLTDIDIPNSVTNIGDWAFKDCTALISIEIPNGVSSLGDYMFSGCESLTSIYIPLSVTSIGDAAFADLMKFTTVYYGGSEADRENISVGSINGFLLNAEWVYNYSTESEVVVSGECGATVNADGTTNLQWTLTDEDNDGTGDTLTISGTGAMADFENSYSTPWYDQSNSITSVIIEDGVTSIGNYALQSESSLNRIAMPTSVTTIGDYALPSFVKSVICYGGSETDKDGITFGTNSGLDNLVWIYNATGLQFDPLSGECGATANADGTTNLQWTLTDDGTLTISGEGAMEDYSNPDEQWMPWYDYINLIQSCVVESGVTHIGNRAFWTCHYLSDIQIAESVTSIGSEAFTLCSNLPEVVIPNGVTSISHGLFVKCGSLTNVSIPEGVTSIGDWAFEKCSSLPSIELPSTLTSIGEGAFYGCNSLPSIELPDSLISIGKEAFRGSGLTSSITIPSNVTSIGENVFLYTSVPSITIPSSVTSIGGGFASGNLSEIIVEEGSQYFQAVDNVLFSKDGTSLICYPAAKAGTEYSIPDTVTSIAPYAFHSCSNLTDIDIPDSVNNIGDSAFRYCTALVSIEIPNGVSSLGEEMFSGCESLTSIYIPLSVTSIEDSAFSSCAKLATVYYGGSETDREQMSIGDGSSYYLLNAEWVYNYSTGSDVQFTVTFDLNGAGGTAPDAQTTSADGKLSSLPTPSRSGYTFSGWYTAASGGTKADLDTVYTQNTTLYAHWTVVQNSSGGSSGGSSGSSSGSSSNSSSSTKKEVSASTAENGSVTLSSSSAKKGDTVTITVTPDEGYKLNTLTVKDLSGNAVQVTDAGDGNYTFTMPASKVTITPTFVPSDASSTEQQPSKTFTDVPSGAYYADAVSWAVEQGITTGTTNDTFSPDDSCTRAQMVTFLWRAAGSPTPASSENPFTDVPAGEYYSDAILWAVEKGITTGISATTFGPNNTVTRGQTVTFLYRAAGSPAVESSNPFKDVDSGTYYADAVQWAASENITNGITADTFSPDGICTRGQIVTFLYRAKN